MAPDGLDIDGDPEARNSAGKEPSVLKQESGCGPCRIEYTSPSQTRKVDENFCFHDNQPFNFQFGEDNKGQEKADGQVQLSPESKGKHFARKIFKEPIAMPFKRPRIDESEDYMKNTCTNGHDNVSHMAGFDPIRCTADKSQTITQKRVHDGKRGDKKNCRAIMKNKYESLASKAGLACSDTFSGGNSILGSHGVKSEMLDMTKQFDELSLFDLLNGSYKYPMLPVDRGKKSSNTNDNIILSVRKACSILCPPPYVLAENVSNSKACQSSQDHSLSLGSTSDYETKDKEFEGFLKKGMDAFQANWIKSTMYQPKKILEQLALPAAHELETFLFNPTVCSVPSQFTAKPKSCGTNLPPFHWSFSHGANNKPSVEPCKVNAIKNVCQGKWVRMGSSSFNVGDKSDKKSFPGFGFPSYGDDMDSLNQQNINDVLEWMKTFTSTIQPPGEVPSCKSGIIGTLSEVQVEENMNSVNGSDLLVPFNSNTFQPHEIVHTLNGSRLECYSKAHTPQEGTSSVVSRCPNEMNLDPSMFNFTFKDKTVLKDNPVGTNDGCFVSSFSCRNGTVRSCDSSCLNFRTLKCKQAYPQELLSAAATLLEMRRCRMGAAMCSSGRNRWPKAPSMKKMKARKSSTSINNPDKSIATTGCNNLIRKANIPSAEHQVDIHRKLDFNPPSSTRESSRWSSLPNKVEKDLNQRAPHGSDSFRPLLAPFSSRAADKDCDNQIKEPQPKPPSAAFRGSSIRDWIRCRNKRP